LADQAKLHHTVPKFYLRGFADDDKRIVTVRLPGVKSYTQVIDKTGATNHFFDTVYYPSLDHVAGRPYGLWVHGNNDTVGAAAAVDKLATGLSLTKAADALEVVGAIDAAVRERAYELGGTLAATLMD
jgi:hypothetical protein